MSRGLRRRLEREPASFSNYGSAIELAAPGVDVLSTTTETRGSYEKHSGTSMACPVVAGVAGLAFSQWDVTNADMCSHLKTTAEDIGLSSDQQGSGQVDANGAVTTDSANSGGGGGGGGDGSSTSISVDDFLPSYSDSDCWTYGWNYSSPSKVVIELDGPNDAGFDLYAYDGYAACPGPYSHDYYSYSTNSQETITIDNPDTSTDLYTTIDSSSGSGSYTLTFTEYKQPCEARSNHHVATSGSNTPPRRHHSRCSLSPAPHLFLRYRGQEACRHQEHTRRTTMPTCRNCDNTASFVVSLVITTVSTAEATDPPELHLDLQCDHCDSTNVDGDPCDVIRPLLTGSGL